MYFLIILLLLNQIIIPHKQIVVHNKGKTVKYICGMYNPCPQTIENVIKESKDRGSIENLLERGKNAEYCQNHDKVYLMKKLTNKFLPATDFNRKHP